jgi:hypothetical protein
MVELQLLVKALMVVMVESLTLVELLVLVVERAEQETMVQPELRPITQLVVQAQVLP